MSLLEPLQLQTDDDDEKTISLSIHSAL